MKKLFALALLTVCAQAHSFDIVAFGTSATNCRNVDRSQIFPVKLQEILQSKGYNVRVINAGVDGDRPVWMVNRIKTVLTPDTKIVIFEPGPNERVKEWAMEPTEKVLSYLKEMNMPTVYAYNGIVQNADEAKETSEKYGAVNYGAWRRDIPINRDHFQYDTNVGNGHLTAEGCALWAKNMAPIIEKIIVDKNLK